MQSPRKSRRPSLPILALALALAGGTALAAPVRGKLELPTSAPDLEATPHHVRAQNGLFPTIERIYEPTRAVTVALTREGAESEVACPARLENGGLLPRTLVGAPGAALSLTNFDGTEYAPRAEGLEALDGSSIPPGAAVTVPMPSEGTLEITDAIHPHVHGRLVVLPGLLGCAKVSELGAFRFEQVDAGEYTLHFFVDGEELATRPLTVPQPGYEPLTIPPVSLSGAR